MVDRPGRLAAVYDLEILDPREAGLAIPSLLDADFRRCAAEAVVVGEKPVRLFTQRTLHVLIRPLPGGLEKCPHVPLQQPLAVLAVYARQHRSRHEREERP